MVLQRQCSCINCNKSKKAFCTVPGACKPGLCYRLTTCSWPPALGTGSNPRPSTSKWMCLRLHSFPGIRMSFFLLVCFVCAFFLNLLFFGICFGLFQHADASSGVCRLDSGPSLFSSRPTQPQKCMLMWLLITPSVATVARASMTGSSMSCT